MDGNSIVVIAALTVLCIFVLFRVIYPSDDADLAEEWSSFFEE